MNYSNIFTPVYTQRVCKYRNCENTFNPTVRNQTYCCRDHATAAYKAKLREKKMKDRGMKSDG